MNISIVIPSYNGGNLFEKSLSKIVSQEYDGNIEIIVIDSGSSDNTVEIARRYANKVIEIPNTEFHHAKTRNFALQYVNNDYVVFTVQDAIPKGNDWLKKLVDTLNETKSQAVYIKQIPHKDADIYARFETEYHSNYLGNKISVQNKSIDEFRKLTFHEALREVRMDNVCAIYRKDSLLENPFPIVDFAEDMAWAKLIIFKGGSILYNPEIEIFHSHNRTPMYRMKRAVVDTIFTSEILERIEIDRSDINLKLLEDIISEVEFFSSDYIKKDYFDDDVVNLYIKGNEIVDSFIRHIVYLSKKIFIDYNVNSSDKESIVQQISHSLIGCLIGQVYVSHLNKNTLTSDLISFVDKYRVGV